MKKEKEEKNPETEELEGKVEELKNKLSENRKKALDMTIPQLKIMNIPSKIKLAEATGEKKDVEKVRAMIRDVEREIQQAESGKAEEKQEEEMGYEDYTQHGIIRKTKNLVKESYDFLENEEYKKAMQNYVEISEIYRFLPKNMKKEIYHEAADIYNKITQRSDVTRKDVETQERKDKEKNLNTGRKGLLKRFFKR